jgi:hypothetical protein
MTVVIMTVMMTMMMTVMMIDDNDDDICLIKLRRGVLQIYFPYGPVIKT